jgi:IclR family pca regulon transcriptional regulator
MANFVNSLDRGLKILRAFTPAKPELRLLDITNLTSLPKTTVIRLLKTLTSLNYIRFDSNNRKYYLGPEVMSLGFTVLSSMDIREIALPYIAELSRISDQSVNLGILDRSEVVYIERIKKRTILNIDQHVGSRLSSYRSSIGRAILAYLEKKDFEIVLREILKEKNSVDFIGPKGKSLLKILEKVRQKGFALNNEELIPGLRAIGAPIFNSEGNVEAAINMPVFSQMVSLTELTEKYAPMLIETAQMISEARGFKKEIQTESQQNQ